LQRGAIDVGAYKCAHSCDHTPAPARAHAVPHTSAHTGPYASAHARYYANTCADHHANANAGPRSSTHASTDDGGAVEQRLRLLLEVLVEHWAVLY